MYGDACVDVTTVVFVNKTSSSAKSSSMVVFIKHTDNKIAVIKVINMFW